MFKFLTALMLLIVASTVSANTIYIRTDGGTATQCTGLANAAYPGSGNNQACAYAGPMVAFGSAGESGSGATTNNVHPGDIVFVEPGQYMVGLNAPGATGNGCNQNWGYDCVMNPIPAGTAANPTQLIGVSDAQGNPPQFYGNYRTSEILNMNGSSYTVVSNLELTNHAVCIFNNPTNPCPRGGNADGTGSLPFRVGQPNITYADNGIFIYNATGTVLKNLKIHNIANAGIQAGSLSNFTMQNVTLRANGWSGFNNDVSGRGLVSADSGNILFDHVVIEYTGCGEQYPANTIYGCFGQASNPGGYGDGLGAAGTSGNWIIQDSIARWNTQDGFDLLYLDSNSSVQFIRDLSYNNLGNQFKAAGNVLIEDSVGVGFCSSMAGQYDVVGYYDGTGSHTGDLCRALGNTVSVAGMPGHTVTIKNNTFASQGNCQVIMAGNSTGGNVVLANNIFVGFDQFQSHGQQSCTFYDSGSSPISGIVYSHNIEFNDKPTAQAGSITTDPKLTNETLAAFNGVLLSGSPAIGAGDPSYCTTFDFNNATRNGCDIGAYDHATAVVGGGTGGGTTPTQKVWCWKARTSTSTPVPEVCPRGAVPLR